jgi:protocatechuate 3,4-dioxygenase beta subunit
MANRNVLAVMTAIRFATLATLFVTSATLAAQDTQYIRAVERAQQQRPAALVSTARIAPPSEPGSPLVVRGRVLGLNGAPAANAVIFAYQTDRGGLYDKPENGPHSWRLRGWVRTDADGRFTFETIRPGSYPNSNNPPHVHFTAFLADGTRYHAGELQLSMQAPDLKGKPEEASIDLRLEARQQF